MATDFRTRFGHELTDALLRQQVVRSHSPSKWYPCGQEKEWIYCHRDIIPTPGQAGTYLAVCGHTPPQCTTLPVKAEDLEEYQLSHDGLGRLLRNLMGLEGRFQVTETSQSDTVELGSFGPAGDRCDVYLAIGNSVAALLKELPLLDHRAIVLLPSRARVPREWIVRYVPGSKVVLGFLVDILDFRNGEITLAQTLHRLSQYDSGAPFCCLVDPTGKRILSEVQCQDIVLRASSFGFFLDGMNPKSDGKFLASCRLDDGSVQTGLLTPRDTMALIQLVTRGSPARASDLPALADLAAPTAFRRLQEARKLADVRIGRTQRWRCFQTLRSGQRGQPLLVFAPPCDLPYAVLTPLNFGLPASAR